MKDDCCCDPAGKPSPGSPSITGGNPPPAGDTGPTKVMLVGSGGIDAGSGQPIARAVGVGANDALKVQLFEMPGGINGTEVRDDGVTILWKNGRAISWNGSGSGSAFTPGSG